MTETLDMTGKDRRFERWLAIIAEQLEADEVEARLLYEDRVGGDLLALSVVDDEGFLEVQVHRSGRGAVLLLLAETFEAVVHFESAVENLHRRLPRRHNAKRKFVHRIERMAEHLLGSFEQRRADFPESDFARFRSWLNSAVPLVGVQARHRTNEEEEGAFSFDPSRWFESAEAKAKRHAARYKTRYGAKISAGGHPRAALYANGTFALGGKVISEQDVAGASGVDGRRMMNRVLDEVDAAGFVMDTGEVAFDASEVIGELGGGASSWLDVPVGAGDCGGCDVPDCDVVDVPDCGSCDCSP